MYPDLELIDKLVFQTYGPGLSNPEIELESQEYSACNFKLDKLKVKFRAAKITPAKAGQFVTIWKRNEKGITQPFDISDNFDFYMIAVKLHSQFGLFIFPKSALYYNKIISGKSSKGKRGFRLYPGWCQTTNKQAQKTQQWQTKYFIEITNGKLTDINKAKQLFKL